MSNEGAARASDAGLEIPPKIFVEMGADVLVFEPGQRAVVRFPVQARWENPIGTMQGGMIVAAMDNAIGPLSYSVAAPAITTQFNTTYLRPVGRGEPYVEVEATVVEVARRQMVLQAVMRNSVGEVVAIGVATCVVTGGGSGRAS